MSAKRVRDKPKPKVKMCPKCGVDPLVAVLVKKFELRGGASGMFWICYRCGYRVPIRKRGKAGDNTGIVGVGIEPTQQGL